MTAAVPSPQFWLSWTVRALKLIALLGFALPWFAVSCAGKPFVEASGYQLALGLKIEAKDDFIDESTLRQRAQAAPAPLVQPAAFVQPAGAMMTRPARAAPPAVQFLAAGAAILLLLGLAFGFLLRGEGFAAASACAAFSAAGLAWATFAAVEMELRRQMAELADNPLGALVAAQVDIAITAQAGLYVTVGAALLAGLAACGALVVALRAKSAPAPASGGV